MNRLNEREIAIYKSMFAKMVIENKGGENRQMSYSPSKKFGRMIYESFTDDELLEIIKRRAKLINHTPTQNEVLKVFRDYLKLRFEKWTYAIKKSGLSKAAGKGGKSFEQMEEDAKERRELLEELKSLSIKKGYIIHPHQVPELRDKLKKFYKNWGNVVLDMNLDFRKERGGNVKKCEDTDEKTAKILENIKMNAYKIGRAPLKKEIDTESRKLLLNKFGTWRNTLFQIGLEPIKKIKPFENTFLDHRKREEQREHQIRLKDCYYTILNLDEKDLKTLEIIKKKRDEIGKNPEKTDFQREILKSLSRKCGSWKNILYQIDKVFGKEK